MKIILCEHRPPSFAKRQDGFKPLPPEGRYNTIAIVEIPDGTNIAFYEGNYYILTSEFINGLRVFEKGVFSEAAKLTEPKA